MKKNFNAIDTLTETAKMLENSGCSFINLLTDGQQGTSSSTHRKQLSHKQEPCFTPECEQQFLENIANMSRFFKTSPTEATLLIATYAIQLIGNGGVDTRDICRYLDINGLDFLQMKSSLQSLFEKRLLRVVCQRHANKQFIVCGAVEDALLRNTPMKQMKMKELDQFQFCRNISGLIENRQDGEIDTMELFDLVKREENMNHDLKFVSEVKKLFDNIEVRTLFYEICDDFVRSRRRAFTGVECTLEDMYDDMRERLDVAKTIMDKSHPIIASNMVELLPGRFLAEAELAPTEKGKRVFLDKDYDLFCAKGGSDARLLTPDKIPARELFFNDELLQDINFLKDSLMDDSFVELQKRLGDSALPKSVTALLHGLPGTGKTAVAEMIAKATGRSVYHVDIAASKTCWFGESEKLFKKIFTDYRQMCEREERKPILLFNEADALFSKRRDVNSGNCAQTENALQNILLEEMEKLDGILIATTNLCDNFDDAFDRRFLFKIKFGKPNTEAKKAIWKSKLPWLEEEACKRLAANYDLSGGEIDNIVRKAMMEEVLTGKRPVVETLESWCRGERLESGTCSKLGFAC